MERRGGDEGMRRGRREARRGSYRNRESEIYAENWMVNFAPKYRGSRLAILDERADTSNAFHCQY